MAKCGESKHKINENCNSGWIIVDKLSGNLALLIPSHMSPVYLSKILKYEDGAVHGIISYWRYY